MMDAPTIPVAAGRIVDILYDDERAVLLELDLAHHRHTTGEAISARARWCSGYAGTGYGDWFIPSIGDVVLCAFPGLAVEGGVGGDLDEGYAFAVIPGESRPPVPGLSGPLSQIRRVSKGRPGEAFDRHVQGGESVRIEADRSEVVHGSDSHTVDGNRVEALHGDETKTIDGNEARETKGTLQWNARKAAKLIGDALVEITAATQLHLSGSDSAAIDSDQEITADAPSVQISASAQAQIESALVRLLSAAVELGQGAMLRLVDERLIEKYNTHQHPGNFLPPGAGSQITAEEVCTADTKAS